MTATDRLRLALGTEVDGASLRAFQAMFGLLLTFAALRTLWYGWVFEQYLAPETHFPWIDGLPVPEAPLLYAMFVAMAVCGLLLAASVRPKLAAAVHLACFLYVELLDRALYLNHYVLVTWIEAILLLLPLGAARTPAWGLWLLRACVGSVYLWAGLCKLNPDWLLRGEPLHTWLSARADAPLLGWLFAERSLALLMSWGGALYDLLVPFALLTTRGRPAAYLLVIAFHLVTWLLFPIGIFPWLMIIATSLFSPPSWPRRWLGGKALPPLPSPLPALRTAAVCGLIAALLSFPGRFLLYGTDVNWTEEGFRLAWRVMLVEKTGMVDFRVVEPATGRTWRQRPDDLTPLQLQQMRTQPDLIAQYARHLKRRHALEGRDVAVYADAWASIDGRPAQRLLRPDVDLTLPSAERRRLAWIVPRR